VPTAVNTWGYTGGDTMVKDAVQKWRATTKEVLLPPGEAQVDLGFAYVDVSGERQQVALFVMSLPYSDAVCIQAFPRECTEAFPEGHNRAQRGRSAKDPPRQQLDRGGEDHRQP
jgi:transposase